MTEAENRSNPPPTQMVTNARLLEPGKRVSPGDILIENGRIAAVASGPADPPDGVEAIDAGGRLLTPGLVDVHTHGIEHWIYELGPEQLVGACDCLARYGVTTVLPTTVPQISDEYMGAPRRRRRDRSVDPKREHPGPPSRRPVFSRCPVQVRRPFRETSSCSKSCSRPARIE